MKRAAGTFIILFAAITSCGNVMIKEKETKIIKIGSGSPNAMYYPVASSVCDIFNKYNEDKSIICKAVLSQGAEFNLDSVENGTFDMGIAQANLQYDAYQGLGKFSGKPHKNLRTLFNIHNEYLTLIVKKNSNINSFSDLRGKRVNIGNKGSGSRILFSQMIKTLGWTLGDFEEIYEESGSNISKVLCTPNKADAAVYIVGHPNKSFAAMIDDCNTELVSLSDSEIETFVKLSPKEFRRSFIPKNTYNDTLEEVETFASTTILTASVNLDKTFVRNFVRTISEHKDELIAIQPALAVINFSSEDDPNLAPLHEGLRASSNR